eukprot:9724074-Lingulodinium_polyedra.AAC.1
MTAKHREGVELEVAIDQMAEAGWFKRLSPPHGDDDDDDVREWQALVLARCVGLAISGSRVVNLGVETVVGVQP